MIRLSPRQAHKSMEGTILSILKIGQGLAVSIRLDNSRYAIDTGSRLYMKGKEYLIIGMGYISWQDYQSGIRMATLQASSTDFTEGLRVNIIKP